MLTLPCAGKQHVRDEPARPLNDPRRLNATVREPPATWQGMSNTSHARSLQGKCRIRSPGYHSRKSELFPLIPQNNRAFETRRSDLRNSEATLDAQHQDALQV